MGHHLRYIHKNHLTAIKEHGMRFRWKLLILMLFMSLGPFITMRWLGVNTVHRLEERAVKQMEEKIVDNTQNDLLQLSRSYSELLAAWRQALELALTIQAKAVENVLTRTAAPNQIYFVGDFDVGKHLPADYGPSPYHFTVKPDGSLGLMNISFNAPVFKVTPTTERKDIQLDIDRLAGVASTYRGLNRRFGDFIFWHYTSLTNGLHSAYPGHGRIPEDYDPRRQAWFKGAKSRSDPFWSAPYIDPETGQVVMAVAQSIHRPHEEIAGVTALVVPVNKLIENRHLIKNIPPGTRSFIVYRNHALSDLGFQIIIDDASMELNQRNWRYPLKAEWLRPDDDASWKSLWSDLKDGHHQLQRLMYQGQDSLWVYTQLPDRQTYLFLITPYVDILEPVRTAGTEVQKLIRSLIRNTGLAVGILAIVTILLAFAFSRSVTRPIRTLAQGAQQLAAGNFENQVTISSRDEFEALGHIFNSIGPKLRERENLQQALDLAREVQQNLLPQKTPHIQGLDIATRILYCDETGGDYLDFVKKNDNCLGLAVGDISGHGISAALLMTTARAFLRIRSTLEGSPGQMITDVNRHLTKDIEGSGSFMTLFYAEIDREQQEISWVRAGHDPAIIYDPQTDSFGELKGDGMALGVSQSETFATNSQTLQPGQILCIGTDGIWESANPDGELYGKDRLRQLIRSFGHGTAAEIRDVILDALVEFRQEKSQNDDMTLMVIKVQEAWKC
jgi:sigma-B regulation protein RsbU (phosphoserine phosphatase)